MRKVLALSLCAMLCAAGCTGQKADGRYHVGFVQVSDAALLDEARRGVIDALKDEGFVDGTNIRLSCRSAQGDLSTVPVIIKELVAGGASMIITNSTPCMVAAAQIVKDRPVVFTVAFSPRQLGMPLPPNMTGIEDPSSMTDLVQLIRVCLPGIRRLGIPYNPSEQNAVLAARNIRAECARQGIELVEMNVFASSEVQQSVSALALKNIQAMVVSADNTLATGIASVVKICNDRKIPLFVTEPGEVERGACAGIGADFYQWGRESGAVAAQIIRGKKPSELPVRTLASSRLHLNLGAAQLQGVSFPDELRHKAANIIR